LEREETDGKVGHRKGRRSGYIKGQQLPLTRPGRGGEVNPSRRGGGGGTEHL